MPRGKNWIDCNSSLPEFGNRVEVKLDFQNVFPAIPQDIPQKWKSTGYLRKSGVWSIKAAPGLTLSNSIPSHWRGIEVPSDISIIDAYMKEIGPFYPKKKKIIL